MGDPRFLRLAIFALIAGCGDHDKLVGKYVGVIGSGGTTHPGSTDPGGGSGATANAGGGPAASGGVHTDIGGRDGSAETGGLAPSNGGAAGARDSLGGTSSWTNDSGGSSGMGTSDNSIGGSSTGGNASGGATGAAGSDATGGALNDPCALVDCRRHSHCVKGSSNVGTCVCDAGYEREGLQCYSTSPIVDVAAGDAHTCALRADGTVGCWGWNMDSALGDGGLVEDSPIPLSVPGITNAIAIGAGGHASCALLANRTVKCWGFLGGGRAESSPVLIEGLTNVVSLAVGGPTTCAVLEDGTAYCWGALSPTDNIVSLAPIRVSRDSGPKVRSMFAGYGRIWAILTDDTLHALADSGDVLSEEVLLDQALRFSVGANGKAPPCVVMQDGSVRCPEANGTGVGAPWSFPALTGYADVLALGRGVGFRCGVRGDGGVLCSGSNNYGELCDGTYTSRDTPLSAVGLSNTTKIAASWFHACAIDQAGKLRCWGTDSHGALGDGRDEFPIEIPNITEAKEVCLGSESACVLDAASNLSCWGNGYSSSTPKLWLSGVSSCSGGSTTCAVMQDGTVHCWGSNEQGQLGDGTKVSRTLPSPVLDLSGVTQVAAGTHSCAVRVDGSVVCWGKNDLGQVGDGTSVERLSPAAVLGITTATSVVVGPTHSCAVLRDGSVRCWGDNARGQLGNGTTASATGAVVALGLTGIERLFISSDTTLALDSQGNAFRWGGWIPATSGSETEIVVDHTPHRWNAPGGIAEVASGYYLRLKSGEVQCNFTGSWARSIGWGETKQLAVSSGLMCAITNTNRVLCSGVGWNGELGDGHRWQRSWPELVASW